VKLIHTSLGLIFHRTLSWHHQILSIKQRTTLRLKPDQQAFTPSSTQGPLHTISCVLSILDYGNNDSHQLLNFG